ncbi:uncharacterized protein KNAG_0M01370 [Huiozyma naganishii CBS 8797]|uniref:Peroxisomal membrane protein PEX14-like KPWE domain-containing protein n=1 Tax=Huiozyma naganishii (strain ATCC MYA-139 / BCRC 22969 / CBS 8797 / KCTC 17520 / NBRC 10181 / NCYC 3082 / Yp74L-3) TaxID=1071383 RepID=J7RDT0_HUIN7|nr:hypothetical protein KNAG_0M01370 [Kazachstania naganishii CBS 8797]CCK72990.1 hypothetical protein KNAG_0M01370 [Kazachstania naganishii CBS 8797]
MSSGSGGSSSTSSGTTEVLSYEEIAECISSGSKPRNIVAVPNVVLDATLASKSALPRRPKPWEHKQVQE